MNPKFINTTNVDNTIETELQQCMSDSIAETSCLELGDEYLPKGHITTHPFSLTLEKLSGQFNNGQVLDKNYQAPQTLPNKGSSFPIEYPIGKTQYKPVGGSGWLNQYTNWKSTKDGPVEYPRVKDGKRSQNNHRHWYWRYCWQKSDPNGKPLYKKGKAVVESIGCPQKKVPSVERAIAARLPHHQILEIIKSDNSPPPPT